MGLLNWVRSCPLLFQDNKRATFESFWLTLKQVSFECSTLRTLTLDICLSETLQSATDSWCFSAVSLWSAQFLGTAKQLTSPEYTALDLIPMINHHTSNNRGEFKSLILLKSSFRGRRINYSSARRRLLWKTPLPLLIDHRNAQSLLWARAALVLRYTEDWSPIMKKTNL